MLFLGIEFVHRKYRINPDITRKLAHVSLALLASTLPIWLDWKQCLICLAPFVVIIMLSYFLGIFKSIHNVQRKTVGEIMFPLGMLASLIIASESLAVYSFAVMVVALADPFAEYVGKKFGKRIIFGTEKTFIGSMGFAIVTLAIYIFYSYFGLLNFDNAELLSMVVLATIIEAASPYGLDNLTVPATISLLCV